MINLTVATFNEREQARPLMQWLENAGIHADILDERRMQRFWFMSEPLAGIHVQVHPDHFDQARELVKQWDREGALKEAVHCPQCGSARMQYPQMNRKFLTTSLVELAYVVRLVDREFYCEDGHYTWPKEVKPEVERDLLGWPMKSRVFHPHPHSGSEEKTTVTPSGTPGGSQGTSASK
jgi:hypothetical protein